MITATTGRPSSGRSTTLSNPKPKATMLTTAIVTPSQKGAPAITMVPAIRNPASSTPLVSSASVNPQSGMHPLDRDPGAHCGAPAVLISDFGGNFGFLGARVEGLDHRRVLVGDDFAAQLAGARDLGVVGVEILRQ